METFEYSSNSNKSKAEKNLPEKRVEKVVTGNVSTKKKSGIEKIAGEFISEDAKNIKSYIIGDVLLPSIKKAISDIVVNGIDMILYGSSGNTQRRGNTDRVSYRNYYEDRNNRSTVRAYTSSYVFDDVILATRGEAEDVLSTMDDLIDKYGVARVADLYDLVGISGNYTDNRYGWTNIRDARIERCRDGYMIKMPKAIPIE
jgi:hypothetical protein